jgi:lipoprotein-anchoring transpeptidase ErfK/SrfK
LQSTREASVKPAQEVVALSRPHTAHSAPRGSAAVDATVAAKRPITGERTVLPVVGHAIGPDGAAWLRVELPGRPNGKTGWIRRAGTIRRTTSMHLVVEIARRRLVVYRSGRPIRTFIAIVGKPTTPTPRGQFFVEEDIALPSNAVGAPFALALSARSDVLQEFDGGPGQIAVHGVANVGGTLGTAASHGCVRLTAPAVTWLVERIRPGDPVSIR